jgi:RNA polymerase sigma factor (sigma-70 family)
MHAAIRELGTLFNEGAVAMLSDGELLDRFAERREASAFEAIVERYGPLVWGVCRRVLLDHHDAEDAFQASFLVLARKAASVMPREKLGNWLYGVAFQTAMKARATRAKRRVRERRVGEMTEPEAVAGEHPDELLARLDREVTRLPEKYRVPIILCELEGKTHRQAAEQLGWPIGTVSGRLSRARALLARRLSRRDAPLTAGVLGVLLAHDVARAGVPPELARSTAQAASLSTAMTGGVVSAEVAALTGEVLKTMLLNKLKLTTAMLLLAVAVTAGGTSLTYRAHANEPANQKEDTEQHKEPSKPADSVKEAIPPPKDQPKPAEPPNEDQPKSTEARRPKQGQPKPGELPKDDQPKSTEAPGPERDQPKLTEVPKEDIGGPKDAEQVTTEEKKASSPLAVEWWEGSRQRKLECGAYLFWTLRAGNATLAYNPATRGVKAVRLNATKDKPLWVTPIAVESKNPQLVALGVRGSRITRVAVFNLKSGKWSPLDLDQPVDGGVWPMPFGPDAVAYEVGEFLYLYHTKTDAWDRLDLRTIADDKQEPRAPKGR